MKRMMTRKTNLAETSNFLTAYATLLLSSGATTLRTEKNIGRMADFYGVKLSLIIMPRHVEVMTYADGCTETHISEWKRGINFFAITALSRLSWRVVEELLDVHEAECLLTEICKKKRLPVIGVTMMAGLANASFCRLFTGDYWAMGFVFLATVCGFYTKHRLITVMGIDMRIATLLVACVSSVISCGVSIYGLGTTPDIALATSVLYLVPGIPYINAFSDLIGGHYVCALSWFITAMETTMCLGTGLLLGNYLLSI